MITELFKSKKKLNKSINQDEAISYGAPVFAESKDLDKIASLNDLILLMFYLNLKEYEYKEELWQKLLIKILLFLVLIKEDLLILEII